MVDENDPNYWWLRLQYALQESRDDDVEAARKQLARLGYRLDMNPTVIQMQPDEGVNDAS